MDNHTTHTHYYYYYYTLCVVLCSSKKTRKKKRGTLCTHTHEIDHFLSFYILSLGIEEEEHFTHAHTQKVPRTEN